MATVIKSMRDLTKILESRIQQALKMTQQEIFKVIQQHISDYYKEPVFRNGTSAIPTHFATTSGIPPTNIYERKSTTSLA